MGHLTVKNYNSLYARMDQFVNGPYDSDLLFEILGILFTDEEAFLCSKLPLLPCSLEKVAQVWGKPEASAQAILDTLVTKGLVYEDDYNGTLLYLLAIPIFGFFEFSMMRTDGLFDHDLLAKLYTRYINEDEGFVRKYFGNEPKISRTYVQEDTLPGDMTSEILSYEKASHIIDAADVISVGVCFCRHKMEHLGRACDAPQEVCLSFGNIARTLIDRGISRAVTKPEARDILQQCIDHGLAQIGDNIKDKPAVICNCCGCCCDLLLTYKQTGMSTVISPSSYLAAIDESQCIQCGLCAEKCPADAISLRDDQPVVDENWCLGCGVCAHFCATDACHMKPRAEKVPVPDSTFQKVVLAVIYQGKLGDVLFSNRESLLQRTLAGAINRLGKVPPIERLLLQKRTQSLVVDLTLKLNGIKGFKL